MSDNSFKIIINAKLIGIKNKMINSKCCLSLQFNKIQNTKIIFI